MELDPIWLNRLIGVALIALFILIWKPLHKRFRWWAIILASFCFGLGGFLAFFARTPVEIFVVAFLIAGGIASLYEGRQKPIEQRKPTVAWMVIHGLWDQLAKEGLPADEIDRLKRLTPEEKARLMETFKVPPKPKRLKQKRDWDDWYLINPTTDRGRYQGKYLSDD